MREGHPQAPESPYGVAKKAAATISTTTGTVRGLEYTALAMANVYGPRQNPHGEAGVVSIFAGKLLGHERPVIYGDGSQTRDFVYVDDVVDAFVRAVDKGGGLLMNIGTGVETSVQQLFDVMAKLTGFKQHARYDPPRPGEVPAQRARSEPGRHPPRLAAVDDARRRRGPHPRALQGPDSPAQIGRLELAAGPRSHAIRVRSAELVERNRRAFAAPT